MRSAQVRARGGLEEHRQDQRVAEAGLGAGVAAEAGEASGVGEKDKPSFMRLSHLSLLSDQPCLVALGGLSPVRELGPEGSLRRLSGV